MSEIGTTRDTPPQAGARDHANFNLGHVQPTAMFGGVMETTTYDVSHIVGGSIPSPSPLISPILEPTRTTVRLAYVLPTP